MQDLATWHTRRFAAPETNTHLSLHAVVRLRWWALAIQALGVVITVGWSEATWVVVALGGVLLVGAAANVVVLKAQHWPPVPVLGALSVLDTVLLTALLALTGGPANPFSVLYLIYVMMAAIATNPGWTWATMAASSVGFGLLFFVSMPLPPALGGHAGHGGGPAYSAHLQGMWMAHTITAAIIARFVGRVSAALNKEREMRAQTSRLLGLATLAAGAAHEIGNPLGTIRVAASELERDLSAQGANPETLRDLALIGDEVGRAHRVLEHMSIGAGELLGEGPVPTDLATLVKSTVASLGAAHARVRLEELPSHQTVRWPVQATTQALTQLLRNAVQASPVAVPVILRVRADDGAVSLSIRDQGPGMSADVVARIGEPFFTTRPGQGKGLGVFIARSLVEHLGGRVEIESAVGQGTVATVWLPSEVVA